MTIAVIIVVVSAWVIAAPYLERLTFEKIAKAMPEVASVYEAEQKEFPQYKIGMMKQLAGPTQAEDPAETPTYHLTLSSNSEKPTENEVRRAGRLACESGVPPGAFLSITAQQSFFFLPFYFGTTLSGRCPEAGQPATR